MWRTIANDFFFYALGQISGVGILYLLNRKGRSLLPPPIPNTKYRYVFDGTRHIKVKND
ncbi:MAG: hypothetical protein ACR2MF_07310 [Chthoniobacterales bacterium]